MMATESDATRFRCVVMGEQSLLIQCAEILMERQHRIVAVVTRDRGIAGWARGRDLEVVEPGNGVGQRLTDKSFDWFFSIANLAIIPDDVLAMAKRGAINFHDGPLPRYAGLNAPVWALLNRETTHGITWHKIEGGVDEGDILKQRTFDLGARETALTLNTKCFEAGIETFRELVVEMDSGRNEPQTQDLSLRSYYGKNKRPAAAAVLDFARDADELDASVRALDHGGYANPLCIPKLVHDRQIALVPELEVTDREDDAAPATVVAVSDREMIIATATAPVRIPRFLCPQGRGDLTPGQVAKQLGLTVGSRVNGLDASAGQRLGSLAEELAAHESFWIKRLSSLEPVELPYANLGVQAEPRYEETRVAIPAGLSAEAALAGFCAWLMRDGGKDAFDVGYRSGQLDDRTAGFDAFFASTVPLRYAIKPDAPFSEAQSAIEKELGRVHKRLTWARDALPRHPGVIAPEFRVVIHQTDAVANVKPVGSAYLTIALPTRVPSSPEARLIYDAARISSEAIAAAIRRIGVLLDAVAKDPETSVAELPLLTEDERKQLLVDWNATKRAFPADKCVHQLFEEQVRRTPDAPALVFEGEELSYRELNQRANQLAHHLRSLGVGPDTLVGLNTRRTTHLVVGALAIQKAGGGYVPLDPAFPADRIAWMIEDSRAPVIVAQDELVEKLPPHQAHQAKIVRIDADPAVIESQRVDNPTNTGVTSDNLAYVIYTSGSTGKPKGVMVEHRQVSNFFTGMDERVPHDPPGSWLAVTSLSFDISVLELFWTLCRGFKVVISSDEDRALVAGGTTQVSSRPIGFGLFYWGNDDGQGPRKYELLLEGAKFADQHGFTSLWTPERHFHAFGGPYPNPSVTGAAAAAVSKNLSIRGGSCVSPLHHPIRIAEEWAVVDNMCNGKVGLAFASGWQPDDFVLRPENAPPNNKTAMLDSIDTVRRLWRGEAVEFPTANGGTFAVTTQPRPVSRELSVWVTTAGNPDTYRDAAQRGANVLTHLLGQSIEEVGEKVKVYREALAEAGHDPKAFKVTLMLHTLVGADREKVRDEAREPMIGYLRSAANLIKQYAWAFPAFKKPKGVEKPTDIDLQSLDLEEMDAILEFAFLRYFEDSGLFGTVEDCVAQVERIKEIDVDEIACLIDYGVPTPKVMGSLRYLAEVVKRTNVTAEVAEDDYSIAAQITRHAVTHMQCTPSMAQMLTLNDEARAALRHVRHLMIGGEAFPGSLAKELRTITDASIENMYGPTETTIWSATDRVAASDGICPIGRPIANTQLYVLDVHRQPVPIGVPGELYIGGDGVTRGYHNRPDLTQERFLPDPFAKLNGGAGRMYRTGDLVRYMSDGRMDFIGRADHQVKIRGYRIELGEIETQLNTHPAIRESVVIAREDTPGDRRLAAYFTLEGRNPPTDDELRVLLRRTLPDYMVPSHFVTMDRFPLTPNAKIDRKVLPRPDQARKPAADFIAPESQIEQTIAKIWADVLGVTKIGSKDNFFELGGHSLLAVQVHRELKTVLERNLTITDIFRFPTIESLAGYLEGGDGQEDLAKSIDRAAARREAMNRRRQARRGRN